MAWKHEAGHRLGWLVALLAMARRAVAPITSPLPAEGVRGGGLGGVEEFSN